MRNVTRFSVLPFSHPPFNEEFTGRIAWRTENTEAFLLEGAIQQQLRYEDTYTSSATMQPIFLLLGTLSRELSHPDTFPFALGPWWLAAQKGTGWIAVSELYYSVSFLPPPLIPSQFGHTTNRNGICPPAGLTELQKPQNSPKFISDVFILT